MELNDLKKLFVEETIRLQQNYYRIAYSYTKNTEDALDIVQEAIYKALVSLHTIEDPACMKTWFYRILVNTSLDFLRKNQKVYVVGDKFLEAHLAGKIYSHPDMDLQFALSDLPLDYRSIIILHYFEDLTIREVAAILDININTAKTRLYAALKKLRYKLND